MVKKIVDVIEDKMEIEVDMNCGDTIIVKATMYQATQNQCDDTPDLTADQTKIPNVDSCSHLNWIAVSQDLLWFNDGPIRYGDTVYVIAGHKTGYYIVRDAMNKRWTNRIDFLESTGVEAYRYNEAELIINS
jgi:3D (Asp-Asp-Asp) domain-containing protein